MNSDSGEISPDFVLFSLSFLILLGPKLIGEEQIWPGTWRRRKGFAGFRQIRGILANFSDFARFGQDFTRITVHGLPESLLRTCWEQKSYC
jgi:hypothetical protein